MAYEKTKAGMLIGFTGITLVILALFIPISTILFSLLIGLLFVLPILALVLILILGVPMVSEKLRKPPKSEREAVVIPIN